MADPNWKELRSDRALVAHRQINSDAGGATVFCVVLADGFIIECGSDGYSPARAKLLANAVNQSDPTVFAFGRHHLGEKS